MQAIFWSGAVLLGLYWLLATVAYGWRSSLLWLWAVASLYCACAALLCKALPFLWLPPLVALLLFLAFLLRCARFRPKACPAPQLILLLGVRQDGTQPRALFSERMREAARQAKAHPAVPLLLAGGKVFGERETEASAMRRALLRRGIAEERLLCEEESRTTRENFALSASFLAEKEVLVVTGRFHAYRAACLARHAVPTARFSFSCPRGGGLFLPHLYLRELCTFTVDLLRGRLRPF